MIISTNDYARLKEDQVKGRYVVNEQLHAFLNSNTTNLRVATVGYSVNNRPIKSITLGTGQKKILMWSQMHGNESTTTKAILDLINLLTSSEGFLKSILENCTIKILPILNPDGAYAYTRVNANQVDLNRDAQNRSQPESKVLRAEYDKFKPDFCFNLHDQRTIYSVGASSKPATVSFLAPSHDAERTISSTRAISMQLIAAMNQVLQEMIPGQIGRYDDAFNANCVGDTFQMLNTPTILFEAGHFQKDYEREKTREYVFYALIKALETIAQDEIKRYDRSAYFDIPENGTKFFDLLIKNVSTENSSQKSDVGILFREVLEGKKISFVPNIAETGNLDDFFGHATYDCLHLGDLDYLKSTNLRELLSI